MKKQISWYGQTIVVEYEGNEDPISFYNRLIATMQTEYRNRQPLQQKLSTYLLRGLALFLNAKIPDANNIEGVKKFLKAFGEIVENLKKLNELLEYWDKKLIPTDFTAIYPGSNYFEQQDLPPTIDVGVIQKINPKTEKVESSFIDINKLLEQKFETK